ncbi:MAG: DUF1294 domain-containing protein, partial [Clostridiales bacterium]|nr:DUF1294 domain-containing protein [Clostridiales bacterium]
LRKGANLPKYRPQYLQNSPMRTGRVGKDGEMQRYSRSVRPLGGAAGMLLAMHLFRHKTQHRKFTILVPLALFLQLLLLLFLFFSRGVL